MSRYKDASKYSNARSVLNLWLVAVLIAALISEFNDSQYGVYLWLSSALFNIAARPLVGWMERKDSGEESKPGTATQDQTVVEARENQNPNRF